MTISSQHINSESFVWFEWVPAHQIKEKKKTWSVEKTQEDTSRESMWTVTFEKMEAYMFWDRQKTAVRGLNHLCSSFIVWDICHYWSDCDCTMWIMEVLCPLTSNYFFIHLLLSPAITSSWTQNNLTTLVFYVSKQGDMFMLIIVNQGFWGLHLSQGEDVFTTILF